MYVARSTYSLRVGPAAAIRSGIAHVPPLEVVPPQWARSQGLGDEHGSKTCGCDLASDLKAFMPYVKGSSRHPPLSVGGGTCVQCYKNLFQISRASLMGNNAARTTGSSAPGETVAASIGL